MLVPALLTFFGLAGLGLLVAFFFQRRNDSTKRHEAEERRHNEALDLQEHIHRREVERDHAVETAFGLHLTRLEAAARRSERSSERPARVAEDPGELTPRSGFSAADILAADILAAAAPTALAEAGKAAVAGAVPPPAALAGKAAGPVAVPRPPGLVPRPLPTTRQSGKAPR